ncbi:p-hydroxybenzoic acid efflux pump subunit AaeA [Caloramator mitchellensis]|uniref:p-hydroxybenzoic acid efflux pump subunit AaeA n=1 Tax=Caloramator mitchellensis TaxID=908809 RepID=A0A0R3JW44_CALMK|nr:HlyD family efflux transporter periplasmic adaptor subunit [Caloramator mitchellensis]KRQ86541.1 p-hydroxybenzoic acid efflux pump subunit AaeA [Caloramator mitchellensis]
MDKKKFIPIVLVVAVLSYLGYIKIMAKEANGNVYYGTVEAETINVSAETMGKISEINVQEGQTVKLGDLIASLAGDESRIKLDIANINKENAKNELSKLEEGNRVEEINAQRAIVNQAQSQVNQGEALLKQAKNNLDSAKINLDYRKKIYEDYKNLYDNNSISKYEFEAAKNQYDLANVNYKNALEQVNLVKSQLEASKFQLKAAEERLNLLVNGATDKTKQSAKLNLQSAEKSSELSKINYDKNNITAPVDGIVETINFNKGEFVNVGSPVATILDINNVYVNIYVPEKALPEIKLGQDVTLKSDFIKDKTIKGKVVYISPEAEFTPMNIVTKEDRTKLVFKVKVKVVDNLDLVRPGMLMDVVLD